MTEINIIETQAIQSKIYTIRGQKVMLDRDLAELYGVENKRLNEQVKRNKERFPIKFAFQLSNEEVDSLRSQFATANISSKSRVNPTMFSEHGVLQVASVLNTSVAHSVSIQLIELFVEMRKLPTYEQLIKKLENKFEGYDRKFQEVNAALKYLINDDKTQIM